MRLFRIGGVGGSSPCSMLIVASVALPGASAMAGRFDSKRTRSSSCGLLHDMQEAWALSFFLFSRVSGPRPMDCA